LTTHELFRNITTFVFDVDGVMTDSTILLLDDGLQARKMNIRDGYALQLAVKKGYRVMVISGGDSPPVITRLQKLGVNNVYMQVLDKKEFLENVITRMTLTAEEILFMGDDIPDLDAMKIVGVAACPSDAVQEIKSVSHYVSPYAGGGGCVRDVIETVLKLNKHWDNDAGIASR
jgi:3-deoxy-D-manno-octulosonate 8-phosphate phosphatase (KDO 8-P phosphatase)